MYDQLTVHDLARERATEQTTESPCAAVDTAQSRAGTATRLPTPSG